MIVILVIKWWLGGGDGDYGGGDKGWLWWNDYKILIILIIKIWL